MNRNRVCAVIVTYNRKSLLLECLESLKKQHKPLDGIFVIDNASTDGTRELLFDKGYIEELIDEGNLVNDWSKCGIIQNSFDKGDIKFCYVRLRENTGGAGGFYEGVKRAYEGGYDWLWLMDDDAEPFEDALLKLSNYFSEDNISALAGVVKTSDFKTVPFHRGFFDFKGLCNYKIAKSIEPELIDDNNVLEIDVASFVGVLINSKSITRVGFPKKELFVYGDDYEYSIRLRSAGRILLVTDSIIFHKDYKTSNQSTKEVFGNPYFKIKYENYWIRYYEIRNNMWLLRRYRKPALSFWIIMIVSWLFNLFMIVFYDDHKYKRIHLTSSAYINAFNDDFDNEKPKKILYNN